MDRRTTRVAFAWAVTFITILAVQLYIYYQPEPVIEEEKYFLNIEGRFRIQVSYDAPITTAYTRITPAATKYIRDKLSTYGDAISPFNVIAVGNGTDMSWSSLLLSNETARMFGKVTPVSIDEYKVECTFPAGTFDNITVSLGGLFNSENILLLFDEFTMINLREIDSLYVEVTVRVGGVSE